MNGDTVGNAMKREADRENDHDVLTFGEAGERLSREIASTTARLAELESAGDSAELQKVRAQLDALRAAAARNSAHPINDANFERFFGYPGRPKRTGDGTPGEQ
ncbi:acyl-CoA synthetase [Mycolicibacterium sp. XJ1819]